MNTDLREFGQLSIDERCAMFRAHQEGTRIEIFCVGSGKWMFAPNPSWVSTVTYRIAPEQPSINWDRVAPEYVALATDGNGKPYLYNNKELVAGKKTEMWGAAVNVDFISASAFASFKPGTCHWTESLVLRPEVHSMKIGESVKRFINHYHCPRCNESWQDESDCTCDDRCPECNLSCSPTHSEDL